MIYENGERTQEAGKRITGGADPDLGKFLTFEEQPKDTAALRGVLWCYGTFYMGLFSVTLVKLIYPTYSLVGGIIIFSIIATARVPGGWGWKTPKVV